MTPNSFLAKLLRFIGILLMALTAGCTLLGGVGTSCAAIAPKNWDSMANLAPFQWLYILFVLTGIALGIMGIRAVVLLVKAKPEAYRSSMIALIAGTVVGAIHILVSRALRGSSMPVDAVVYTTVLTLAVFLVLRIPGVWRSVDFSRGKRKDNLISGGMAAIMLGGLCLTIPYTMGATHTWGGVNYANAFATSMNLTGLGLLLAGGGLLLSPLFHGKLPLIMSVGRWRTRSKHIV